MMKSLGLQVGLESISDYVAPELDLIKPLTNTSPLGERVESALESNFQLKPVDAQLVNLARPGSMPTEWLQPHGYQNTLNQVKAKLEKMGFAECEDASAILGQFQNCQHQLSVLAGLLLKA